MELEMFLHPKDATHYFEKFKDWSLDWLKGLGISEEKLRLRDQEFKERAHYNKIATDVEYEFPFGWKEFQGIHYRSDWDLKRHGEFSGEDFTYFDEEKNEKYIPHIVEYSIGLSRLLFVILMDSYREEGDRVILKFHKDLAPYKVAVFPLVRNKENIVQKAKDIFSGLVNEGIHTSWDDRGNVGKRYYAQDEIGTPYCVTVDYTTLEDETVTIRDRDTTKQERIKIDEITDYLKK
jgi:glycyl-tRNA synthetase